jgi:UDP-N-acetylmuramoylalanine--D-glutamate ligase
MKNKNWNKEVETTEQDMFNSLLELRRQILEESVSDVQSTRHRQELIGSWNEIEFINDSKAVNVDLTWYSLERLQGTAVWIVGGLQVGQDYSMLKELVGDKVRGIVCLGRENSLVFKTFMSFADVIVGASTADEAVKAAAAIAQPGDKVILSPACSSHDLFDSYEDRGDQFTKAVQKLIESK